MRTRRAPELALAAIALVLAIPATYAISRVVQARFFPETNPALVVWTTRTAMYWRAALGLYVGAIVAPVTYLFACRDLRRAARFVGNAAIVVAIVAALQGALVP